MLARSSPSGLQERAGHSSPSSPCRRSQVPRDVLLPRSQKLEFNVHVVARFRPPLTADEEQDGRGFVVNPSGRSIESMDGAYHFELDQAFEEDASQEAIYDYVGRPVVCDVLDGYNGTIFAYGQTGSGKTYCMFGPDAHRNGLQGVVPRTAEQVFDLIEASTDENTEFTLRCSYLEVYREKMRDLLDPDNKSLKVKELPQRGLFVHGLTREYVTCAGEVMHVVRTGNRARAVGRTLVNEHSSRSHAVFMIQVEQRAPDGSERLGKLTLVDLAGSEKVAKSGCVGDTLEEAKKINWSLSALGNVIDALAEQRSHVPYRDSRLTRVLEEALGGNCRTTLLVALSPLMQHYDETISSLRFATRAKAVRNHAKVNYMYSADQLLLLVAQLQRELAGANKQIAHFSLKSGEKFPESQQERPKEEQRRRRSEPAWQRGKVRRLPLDKLQGDFKGDDDAEASKNGSGAPKSPSGDTSCGSARSLASSGSTSEEPGPEGAAPFQNDEAWRPLALAARDAMKSLQEALMAQEKALEEAGLMRADQNQHSGTSQPSGSSSSGTAARAQQGAPESGAGGPPAGRSCASNASPGAGQEGAPTLDNAALSERWRALRHAVDARSLHWRLQVERHKTETLALELEMRKKHTEELEKDLEKFSSRLAVMFQDGSLEGKASEHLSESLRRLLPGVGKSSAGGSSSSVISGGGGGKEQGSIPSSARHARIARPVPRGSGNSARGSAPVQGFCEIPATSSGHGSPKRISASLQRCVASVAAEESAVRSPVRRRLASDGSEAASVEAPDRVQGHDWRNSWLQTSCRGSVAEEALPVAGTGEAVSSPAIGLMASRGGNANIEFMERHEALQLSHRELEAQVAEMQTELEDRNRQLVELAAELGSKDVRVSALRHEVHVRDALLGHLHEDSLRRAEHKDHEVEQLVEQAMLPLTSILSSRQASNAAAVGERSLLPQMC